MSGFTNSDVIYPHLVTTIRLDLNFDVRVCRYSSMLDAWRFGNTIILVFVPLLLLVLFIEMSLCPSISTRYRLIAWELMILYIFWSFTGSDVILPSFGDYDSAGF